MNFVKPDGTIKDEYYLVVLEGNAVLHAFVLKALNLSLGVTLRPADIYFLRDLQSIHDDNPPESWRIGFEWFAKINNLNPPPLPG